WARRPKYSGGSASKFERHPSGAIWPRLRRTPPAPKPDASPRRASKRFSSGQGGVGREFIRMNESTSTKVHFFRHVIDLALRSKLKTAGQSLANRIDKLLESRTSRVLALTGTVLGLLSWIIWLALKAI